MNRMLLICVLALASLVSAQTPQASAPLSFEAASIKPSDPGQRGVRINIAPGGRFMASNVTVKMLIGLAYDVRDFQIVGLPGWASGDHYDIVATANKPNLERDQLHELVQSLLADRFGVKLHREKKELPTYELVVAKNGSKLKQSEGQSEAQSEGEQRGPARGGQQMRMGRGQLNAQMVPIAALVNMLSQQLGRPVIDKTGLKGAYDFELQWTPEDGPRGPGDGDRPPETAPVGQSGPSIFTAVQEQLGLKLEASKGPAEILVIDKVEKATEN